MKCPVASTSVDNDGKTPLHHLLEFNSRRNVFMVKLLMKHSDDTIIHKAIKSRSPTWVVIKNILHGNAKLISAVDESSGFLPFMTAALDDNSNLTIVFKLLQMKPDLLVNL